MFNWKSKVVNNALIQLGEINEDEKGRPFKSRFIQAGIAGYPKQFGNVLITKETLDKFVNTLVDKPVIINHKEKITEDDKVGKVTQVWFNSEDGWYWCSGYLTDETAINLIKDKNWSVSCSYDVLLLDDEGGTENNVKYDQEFLNGVFTHLAIVENPRYERANIVVNSKTEVIKKGTDTMEIDNARGFNGEEGDWITVKGTHIFIPKGANQDEVIQKTLSQKQGGSDDKPKEHSKEWHEQRYNNRLNALKLMATQIKESPDYNAEHAKETIQELLKSDQFGGYRFDIDKDNFIKEGHGDALAYIGQIYGKENGDREKKQEAGFKLLQDIVRQDLSKQEKDWLGIKQEPKQEDKEKFKSRLEDIKNRVGTISKGEQFFEGKVRTAQHMLKTKLEAWEKDLRENEYSPSIKQVKERNINIIKEELGKLENLKGESEKHPKREMKSDNSKEQDMALIDELKKLIKKVQNNKEQEMSTKDRILSILNEKEVEEDVIEEIENELEEIEKEEKEKEIKNKKKAKNEEDKKEDKEEADNKKAKNEDEEDKKEEDKEKVKEVEKDVEKDVDNKCKNSVNNAVDYYNKVQEVYNSSCKVGVQTKYETQADRIEAGNKY